MSTAPRLSVLMAVFNTADYLPAALHSISAQTFTDFELIAIDDGSTDSSGAVLQQFAEREPRARVATRANRGLIATRNELLDAARGTLVAWMDSDDVSLPLRLALQVAAFERDPELVCLGSAAQCIDPQGRYLNVERYPPLHTQILLDQQTGGAMRFPTTMMRRDAAVRAGGFREPFRIGEDFDLLLRLSETGKMANLPEVLYLYRQRLASVCATLGPQWPAYRDLILELAHERRSDGRDRLQRGVAVAIRPASDIDPRQHEWRVYHSWAGHALSNGNVALSSRYALTALGKQPLSRETWRMLLRIARRGPGLIARRAP